MENMTLRSCNFYTILEMDVLFFFHFFLNLDLGHDTCCRHGPTGISNIYNCPLASMLMEKSHYFFFFLNRSINVGQMVGFRLVIFVFFSDRKMWTRDNKMKMKCNIIWKVMLSTCHKLKTACWMNQLTKTQDFQEITSIERERGREREREVSLNEWPFLR